MASLPVSTWLVKGFPEDLRRRQVVDQRAKTLVGEQPHRVRPRIRSPTAKRQRVYGIQAVDVEILHRMIEDADDLTPLASGLGLSWSP